MNNEIIEMLSTFVLTTVCGLIKRKFDLVKLRKKHEKEIELIKNSVNTIKNELNK